MQRLLLLSLLTLSATAKYSIRSDVPEDEPPLPGESPVKYGPTPTPQWDLPCNHPGCPYIDHHPDLCSRAENKWKCLPPFYDNAAVPVEFMKDAAVTTPSPELEDSDGQYQDGKPASRREDWWVQTFWTTAVPVPESGGMRAPGVTAAPTGMVAALPVETGGSGSGSEGKGENGLGRRQNPNPPSSSRPFPGRLPAFCYFFKSARGCQEQEAWWLAQATLRPQATTSADQDGEAERREEERPGPVPPCALHPKYCHHQPTNGKDLAEQELDVPEPRVQSEHNHFFPTPTIPTGFITSFTQAQPPSPDTEE